MSNLTETKSRHHKAVLAVWRAESDLNLADVYHHNHARQSEHIKCASSHYRRAAAAFAELAAECNQIGDGAPFPSHD